MDEGFLAIALAFCSKQLAFLIRSINADKCVEQERDQLKGICKARERMCGDGFLQ